MQNLHVLVINNNKTFELSLTLFLHVDKNSVLLKIECHLLAIFSTPKYLLLP